MVFSRVDAAMVGLAAAISLCVPVTVVAQTSDLPEPIAGPENEEAAGFAYRSEITLAEEYLRAGEVSFESRHDFCNRDHDARLAFAWLQVGFAMLENAPLEPQTCVRHISSGPAWALLHDSQVVFSDGSTSVPRALITCGVHRTCEQSTVPRSDWSRIAVELPRPNESTPARLELFMLAGAEDIQLSLAWSEFQHSFNLVTSDIELSDRFSEDFIEREIWPDGLLEGSDLLRVIAGGEVRVFRLTDQEDLSGFGEAAFSIPILDWDRGGLHLVLEDAIGIPSYLVTVRNGGTE